MIPAMPAQRSILECVIDLCDTLAARCRMVDADQTLGLSQTAIGVLDQLQQYAAMYEAELSSGQIPHLSETDRQLLMVALLNMLLLNALCAKSTAAQEQESALPADAAEAIAHLLVSVGVFTQEIYAHRSLANNPAFKRYFTEAISVSLHMGPLADAFAAAMRGDRAAAEEALRIFNQFLLTAQAGQVMLPPWELEGGANP